jgi:hypothetical protein
VIRVDLVGGEVEVFADLRTNALAIADNRDALVH